MPDLQSRRFTRRQVLGAAALGAGAFFLRSAPRSARAASDANHHLVWVWQFSTDEEPNLVGAKLRDHGLGIILKTHDGVTWMSEYDTSDYAVSGPEQVQVLAKYFEDAGVPFHAWCVVHGRNPIEEARMAAGVVLSGARSIFLDVEPHAGFWQGTADDATRFGNELRRLAPEAQVVLSIDPRPWMLDRIPMPQLVAFSNALAPQNYWLTFDTQPNYDKFKEVNYQVPAGGVTPEFLLTMSQAYLKGYGLPIIEVGQGATEDPDEWIRFVDGAFASGSDYVTAWRYGVMSDEVFGVLKAKPAKQPPIAPSFVSYTVQPGDTLGLIAANFGTTVDAIVAQNGLADPNYLYVGQQLSIPGAAAAVTTSTFTPVTQPVTPAGGGQTYVVQPGDTLHAIAGQFGTTASTIASRNGLDNMDYIYVGQELVI